MRKRQKREAREVEEELQVDVLRLREPIDRAADDSYEKALQVFIFTFILRFLYK